MNLLFWRGSARYLYRGIPVKLRGIGRRQMILILKIFFSHNENNDGIHLMHDPFRLDNFYFLLHI